MTKIISSQQWLQRIGKERIQAFQDVFTRVFEISLCLMDLEGKTLTVWSNSSLFCHYMMHNSRMRCMQERQNAIKLVVNNRKSKIFTCYLGMTYFICPIFYLDEVICVAYGGGFVSENNKSMAHNQSNFHIPVLSDVALKNIMDLLGETVNLLNHDLTEKSPQLSAPAADEANVLLDPRLSRRESEIALLICDGKTNKEIAQKLFISEKTVKTHVSNILNKLEMKDRMQIAIYYR